MKYTVVWTPPALDQLTRLWLQASDRNAVAEASNRTESALRFDPDKRGRTFPGGSVIFDPPIAVAFKVSPDDRLVTVFKVWRVIG
jgi:hypothetical protein